MQAVLYSYYMVNLLRVHRDIEKGDKKKKKHKALQSLLTEGQDVIRSVQTLLEQVRKYWDVHWFGCELPTCDCVLFLISALFASLLEKSQKL